MKRKGQQYIELLINVELNNSWRVDRYVNYINLPLLA